MKSLNEYKLFLFDMDGTLVDSEPLKGQAIAAACNEYGADVNASLYTDVMGQSWQKVTERFFSHAAISPDPVEFRKRFKRHYKVLLDENVSLTPGVEQFIKGSIASGKRCGVVSSAARWMAEHILLKLGLYDCFDIIITQEDVTKHKPDPEAYLLALHRTKINSDETLVFEDSRAGLDAAIASHCDVIAIKHSFNLNNDLGIACKSIASFSELTQ
jgi:HAD superfamily hydrolase (TIGR01509 family)